MQELVLLLTGVAGAASAVAYRRLPRGSGRGRQPRRPRAEGRPAGGADSGPAAGRIRSKIHALAAERDILGKAISRVRGDPGLGEEQKGALLEMYQRQLGAVLAKIDRLEEASKYPDIGPVGDGLIALMDQKLSSLDERLHEISARMAAGAAAPPAALGQEGRPAAAMQEGRRGAGRRATARAAEKAAGAAAPSARAAEAVPDAAVAGRAAPGAAEKAAGAAQRQQPVRPVEITTLTTINGSRREFPAIGRAEGQGAAQGAIPGGLRLEEAAGNVQPAAPQGVAGGRAGAGPEDALKRAPRPPRDRPAAGGGTGAGPEAAAHAAPPAAMAGAPSLPRTLPKPAPVAASGGAEAAGEGEGKEARGGGAEDGGDDDLAAIMADIRSTLSKLEQAEVE